MKRKNTSTLDAESLVDDAHELIAATAHVAGENVLAARNRLTAAVKRGREILHDVRAGAIEKSKAADELIRENPYQAIGIAVGLGALLGLYLGRRNKE
jgi:ElaB/YqjD/DUF883 family membrane-anchored ribosome-binding protein